MNRPHRTAGLPAVFIAILFLLLFVQVLLTAAVLSRFGGAPTVAERPGECARHPAPADLERCIEPIAERRA